MRSVKSESIGLPPGYEIFEDGRVFSTKRGIPKLLTIYMSAVGYPAVTLMSGKFSKPHYIHRLLGLGFVPNPDGKPQINHIDGNKRNYALANLEWVTDSENKIHAYVTGLVDNTEKKRSSSRQNAMKMIVARRKFSPDQVSKIKALRESGRSLRSIAVKYQCAHRTISQICSLDSYQTEIQ